MSRPSVEFFCLAVPESLLGNHSVQCFRKLPLAEKFLNKRGGGIKTFQSEICCLIVPKVPVGETFGISLVSGVLSRPSAELFLYRSTEKFRR